MPTYSYSCNKCHQDFELFFYIKDYISNPPCEACKDRDTYRLYAVDVATQATSVKKADSELKTIGDLANRNRDKLSEDEKIHLDKKHNEYRENQPENPLPQGMSRVKKPPKIKWTK